MIKLTFFVTEDYLESVKDAIFNAGAGKIGDYDRCCWQVAGIGQFRPLKGSDPYIGTLNQEERLTEYRVETLLHDHLAQDVAKALKTAHPYETPAYDFQNVLDY